MKNRFLTYASLALLPAAVFCADALKSGAREAITLCTELLIPSLFPFFVLSGLLIRLGLPELTARLFRRSAQKLFRLPPAGLSAFAVGIIAGYPLGAATLAELYRSGAITREEAERLLLFCNNTGPAFAVGVLGAGVFGSTRLGLLLYTVHVITALALGILLRAKKKTSPPSRVETVSSGARGDAEPLSFSRALTESVFSALRSMATVCGNVLVFSSLLAAAESLGLLSAAVSLLCRVTPLTSEGSYALLFSLLELSNAVSALRALPLSPLSLSIAAFALGWGGACVQLQSVSVLGGISYRKCLLAKLLHGLLSASVIYIMSTYLPIL